MAPSRTAENPILKLKADQIVAIEIQKVGDSLIRREILLIKFESDRFRILIAGARIIDGDRKQPICAIRLADCGAQVCGKGGYATSPGKIVADESNTCR
jgi:hypothetical protein